MDRDTAKQYIKEHLEEYLESRGIDPRKPFRCLNPDHNDRHPSMSVDKSSSSGPHCKCFSCQAYYDTFDLIGLEYGLTEDKEIFKKAYEVFHLDSAEYQKPPKIERNGKLQAHSQEAPDEVKEGPKIDFTSVVEAAHKELLNTPEALAYLQRRGLSARIIEEYKLGYDHEGYNHLLKDYPQNQAKSKKAGLYRFVYPYPDTEGRFTYFLTEIADRSQVDEWNGKYRKISKGESGLEAKLFNERYLQNPPKAIFICEGVFDALSVEEAGGKAIAFVGTAHRRFLGLCKKYRPQTTFIIALDNDGPGQESTERVKAGLEALEIPYIVRSAAQGKDFNEALQADKAAFIEYIRQAEEEAEAEQEAAEAAERDEYLKTSAASYLQNFIDGIAESVNTPYIPTGYSNFDEVLDGGLYEGLYTIGAISSLGKTTLIIQIADQIAQAGTDVLIFSLEMSRAEIIAKSISRLTIQLVLETGGDTRNAKTVRGITTGKRYENYSKAEKDLISQAITRYSEYAGRVYISEGIGDIGAEKIRETVERHKRFTGRTPVIFIDYLQILAPYNERYTDKMNTDKAVIELRRISRDHKTPVIAISSFNRQNYKEAVTMEAFKESGAIEYSSDILIGLQLKGAGEKNFDATEAKRQNPREIELVILKNRNGRTGDKISFKYYPLFNYFIEE